MTDEVADTNSAEVDYATIDGANVGLVKIIITEGIVVADSTTKHKAVSKTLTEGVAVADTVPSKFKAATKTFVEKVKVQDQSYFLPFVVIRRLYEYPAQRIKTGFLWAHIGKTHIGYYYHRIKSILDED